MYTNYLITLVVAIVALVNIYTFRFFFFLMAASPFAIGFLFDNPPPKVLPNLLYIGMIFLGAIALCILSLLLIAPTLLVGYLGYYKNPYWAVGLAMLFTVLGILFAPYTTGITEKIIGTWPREADITTYHKISDSQYAKDKNSVYFQRKLIPGADTTSFRVDDIDSNYAKDKNSIYYYGKALESADLDTFHVLSPSYAKDKKTVWCASLYETAPLFGADLTSFETFIDFDGVERGRDKNHERYLGCTPEDSSKSKLSPAPDVSKNSPYQPLSKKDSDWENMFVEALTSLGIPQEEAINNAKEYMRSCRNLPEDLQNSCLENIYNGLNRANP